jgi:predicted tellurium resistance membrane protein TerC
LAFDTTSIIMFAFVFVLGFVFSILGVTDLAYSVEKKKNPWLGLIGCLIATVIWLPFNIIWTASATSDMFVGFGWLFFSFGIIFLCLTLLCVGLFLKNSAKPEEDPTIRISER